MVCQDLLEPQAPRDWMAIQGAEVTLDCQVPLVLREPLDQRGIRGCLG